jgi:AraC family transcriptional regulator, arabinose operon regulatory protein
MKEGIQKKKEGFEGQKACILPMDKLAFCATNFFCKNLYITDIGYYPNAAFHNRERAGGCPQYILIHCVKGKGWYDIQNVKYAVKTNDFFIVPSNTEHSYGADTTDPWSIYWVHFTGDLAKFYFELLMPEQAYAPQKAIVNTTRHFLFDDIIQHLELMNNDENIIYSNSYLYAFLSSFQASEMKKSTNDNDVIQQCITYMKQNIDKNLYLEDLVKVVGLSPSHLSAEFKKRMKYSPMQLFTSLKIQKACQMLLEKKHSVKTVAFSLGYEDQYHFSRVFKNTMGVSPRNFKKE